MSKTPIADLWHGYAERVVPADAEKIQMRETKRAFYAGAHGMFIRLVHESSKGDTMGIQFMNRVDDEAKKFAEEVLAGRA